MHFIFRTNMGEHDNDIFVPCRIEFNRSRSASLPWLLNCRVTRSRTWSSFLKLSYYPTVRQQKTRYDNRNTASWVGRALERCKKNDPNQTQKYVPDKRLIT